MGAGGALVLAACMTLGLTMRNHRNAAASGKPSPHYRFVTASRPTADPATPLRPPDGNGPILAAASRKWQRFKGFFTGSPAVPNAPASTVSTARDLFSGTLGMFGPEWEVTGPTAGVALSGDGAGSTSRKTDSARTMHSGTNPPNVSLQGHEEAQELWTRGVDPADVEIHRDARGQPIVLGRGVFAVVYLGRWQATLVAVKVMLSADSDAAQQQVRAEADVLRSLRHPSIVLLMAICIAPNQQVFRGPI
jgi:hypothetical protein